MKVLAMYLPQFHRVKENDEWWGEGFTEWTAVKRAMPLFEDHYQPREPLNDNYYDLMEKETMEWQVDLMHTYGVDGMCFYHYWFKDGRRILEKPAENLLEWKDVNMPFCFSWANEAWARSWSNLRTKNHWASSYETKTSATDNGELLPQWYGEEEDWKEHFLYLLPFFKDERYIKIEGKPLILIHVPSDIYCLEAMMQMWRKWAVESGFPGLYVIGSATNYTIDKGLDAQVCQLSASVGKFRKVSEGRLRYEYDALWKGIFQNKGEEPCYYQGIVGFDTTPRHGKRGIVFENAEPGQFKMNLAKLLAKSFAEKKDIVFINAWNEWGEGMYLEPDKKYGYGFLEGVKWAKAHYTDYIEEMEHVDSENEMALSEQVKNLQEQCYRANKFVQILNEWLCLKENNYSIADSLLASGYKNVAIYGAGLLGKHLLEELCGSEVEIAYLLDRKVEMVKGDYTVYAPTDDFPTNVDAIIVTTVQGYDQIKELLEQKGQFEILHLESLIMGKAL